MARTFLTPIDLSGLELRNFKIMAVASLPTGLGTSDAGRMVTLTSDNRVYEWNGSAWGLWATQSDTLGGASDSSAHAGTWYQARGNHTGTQLRSTVSDFDAGVIAHRLDELAAPTNPVGFNGQRLTSVGTPSSASDGASKGYVDSTVSALSSGLALKGTARVATATNISLTAPGATIDGITMAVNDVVILMGQTTGSQNGPWTWLGTSTTMTRPANWAAASTQAPGAFWDVREGATAADLFVLCTTDSNITVDTTSTGFVVRGASTAGATTGYGTTVSGSQVNVNPGTGILVPSSAGSSVSIDTTIVGRKITGTIPASTTGIFSVSGATVTINHALNNQAAALSVRYGALGATPGLVVEVDNTASDANNIVVTLPSAPSANQYICQIVG